MNKDEDRSVIPLCLKDFFHEVPRMIMNELHHRKAYYLGDINGLE